MKRESRIMKKPTALAAGLNAIAKAAPAAPVSAAMPQTNGRPAAAKGTVLIGAHFPPQVRRTLLLIQAEQGNEGKNLKTLLGEAINLLADQYGKPRPYADHG
jgi:hypothetical protein